MTKTLRGYWLLLALLLASAPTRSNGDTVGTGFSSFGVDFSTGVLTGTVQSGDVSRPFGITVSMPQAMTLTGLVGSHWTSALHLGPPYYLLTEINSLAVDPSNPAVLYAGSQFGDVFKSTNTGQSWSRVAVGHPVGALAVDPLNPQVVYAGTPDAGVFKSLDGGTTWVPENTGLTDMYASALVLDPSAGGTQSTVYVGLYNGVTGGVFKSVNGGANWTSINGTFPTAIGGVDVISLALARTTPPTLFAISQGQGLFRTTDAGAHWSFMNLGGVGSGIEIHSVAVSPQNSAVIYAGGETDTGGGEVWQTTDGGTTSWKIVSPSTVAVPPVSMLLMNPANPNVIYAATIGAGIYVTPNGGQDWSPINDGLGSLTVTSLAMSVGFYPPLLHAGTIAGTLGHVDGVYQTLPSSVSLQAVAIGCDCNDTCTCVTGCEFCFAGGGDYDYVDSTKTVQLDASISSISGTGVEALRQFSQSLPLPLSFSLDTDSQVTGHSGLQYSYFGNFALNAILPGNTQPGTPAHVSLPGQFYNASTGTEESFTIDVTFTEVDGSGGQTTVDAYSMLPLDHAPNFAVDTNGFPATYLDLRTTASYVGPVTVCIHYPDADQNGFVDGTGDPTATPPDPGIPETSLRIMHGENGQLVDRTTSLDIFQNTICATTATLSPFAIAVNAGIPGGGSAATDCTSEWVPSRTTFSKRGKPLGRLVCHDGDGGCDGDATSGQCTFTIQVCPNVTDPRLAACTPTDIASYTVLKPLPGASKPGDAANAAAIIDALAALAPSTVSGADGNLVTFDLPFSGTVCAPVTLVVPTQGTKAGRTGIKLQAVRSNGSTDSDTLKLVCAP
jgi:hypothetical protein